LRRRQAKNLLALLFLSQGIPMLLAGDEVLRSQGGNNNAWCQDNALGWFDWSLVEANGDMLRFVRGLIALRKRHACLRRRRFLMGVPRNGSDLPDIVWHGTRLGEPDWADPQARTLAWALAPARVGEDLLYIAANMDDAAQHFELPRHSDRAWHTALDTGAVSPTDLVVPHHQIPLSEGELVVRSRSVVVLEGRPSARKR
jgi:glycogen operon protein